MKLNTKFPVSEMQKLGELVGKDESIRYALASDLTLDRRFGQSFIAVTDKRIVVLDHAESPRTFDLEKIKEIRIDELFGSSRLVAVGHDGDGERSLIYYTRACVPEFAVLCRVVNEQIRKQESELPEEDDPAYCARCGAPLPERGSNCPLCVPRLKVFFRLLELAKPYRTRLLLPDRHDVPDHRGQYGTALPHQDDRRRRHRP